MSHRTFPLAGAALISAAALVAAACSQQSPSPAAPTATSPLVAAEIAPGVGIKTTSPALLAPGEGVRTETLTPELIAGTAAALHLPDSPPFEYRFELQTTAGEFIATSEKVLADSDGQVRWTPPVDLELDSPYRWRARAELGDRSGPWSAFSTFLSLDYRGLNPRPADGVWPSTGPAVVDYVAAAFPDYLEPTGSLGERLDNMEFLRDRVIEAGVCGGLDVALNLKRGIGPHSHDAIAWRKPNGFVEVVDIALAFDAYRSTMGLHWTIVAGPSGYDPSHHHPGC